MGRRHKVPAFVVAVLACAAPALRADDGEPPQAQRTVSSVALPGSFWISGGHVGPAERDNAVAESGFEQGVVAWSHDSWFLVPYAAVRFSADIEGKAWNNRRPTTVAVKLVRRVPNGVLQAGGGVMVDRGAAAGRSAQATAFVSYWAGWTGDRSAHTGGRTKGFPGSISAISGLLTAQDPENWITAISAQQGVVVHRFSAFSTVPYVAATAGFDSQRRGWENRVSYDAGVKLVRPIVGGVVEAGVAHRGQRYVLTNTAGSSPVAFVNLWIGWNPRALIGQ
jgi:hypothetical protein